MIQKAYMKRSQANPSDDPVDNCLAAMSGFVFILCFLWGFFFTVCPESVNILAIVLVTIGSIVIVGLIILLIWKLYTTIHDRREFAKFEKETQNAKWDTVSICVILC